MLGRQQYSKCVHLPLLFIASSAVLFKASYAYDSEPHSRVTTFDGMVNEKNESIKAYEIFNIVMDDETEGVAMTSTQVKHIVFKDGLVQPNWKMSTEQPSGESTGLFYHSPYADRITFDFFFGAFRSYMIAKPSALSSVRDVANPKVIDFQIDGEEHSGSFSIVYDCQKQTGPNRLRNTTINVIFPIVSDMSVKFSFQKTCGGGDHKYMEFGYYEQSDNEGAEVSRMTFPPNGAPQLVVGPHVMSSKLFLLLHKPAESQEFFHATAKSSSSALSVSVQGPVFGGVLQPERPTMLYIFYDCHQTGKQKVTVNVPIRPFDDLNAAWVKDCGGGIADGFSVGTDAFETEDIVHKGVTNMAWSLALKSTSGRISDTAPVVNSSTRFKDFWVSNQGIALHVAPEIITVEKPDVLSVYGERGVVRSSGLHNKQSGVMSKGEKMRFRTRLICKKKGRSLVVITFPIKSFNKVDFGFVKECSTPKQYRHSGFLRTANSAMFAVSIFMVMAFMTCWRFNSDNRKNVRMSQVGKVQSTFENSQDIFSVGDDEGTTKHELVKRDTHVFS